MIGICAACGLPIEGPGRGQVWRDGQTADYHHDDEKDCYTTSSWENFPELDTPDFKA